MTNLPQSSSSSSSFPLWASVVVDGHCSKVAVFNACATEGGGVYSSVRPSDHDHNYDDDDDYTYIHVHDDQVV